MQRSNFRAFPGRRARAILQCAFGRRPDRADVLRAEPEPALRIIRRHGRMSIYHDAHYEVDPLHRSLPA